ncbi:ATP-binding protein [Geomonas subterranea]|uniref:ATP-binding protein n=1 Tax=Geomonas subterranea TaxID=2847989 RepID=A0ABX8LG81_9BACT|nr:ATP-binding protein [Geomonas subterranea]QXE89243.1 ATP-binding protein [Geomonas subterranea]QXM08645.1 ATP-binding protein [Geomonas subterranea]
MIASSAELIAVLRQYNPWWSGGRFQDLPTWRRAAFREVNDWLKDPPAGRALLLSGARQIGKTTLLLQAIDVLLDQGVPPTNILYATFDHPLLKLIGLDGLLRLWREFEPAREGVEYLFLDEIQATKDWQVWLKHQVDFEKRRRIAVTGSATPLETEGLESGVGRWHTIRLATLSFYEYLQIRNDPVPQLPAVSTFVDLFEKSPSWFARIGEDSRPLTALFYEYLLRGGFPQSALVKSIPMAQKLLREDIVDKVLKRDMTALFGVRRVLELEQTFLYLCLHDGGLLDMQTLCKNLEVKKPTAVNFINLLEATHLIYRLLPFGYGKEILRAKAKVYLADAAIAPGVLLKGKGLVEDADELGKAVETAFFKHVFTRYYQRSISFSYWRGGKKDQEVDIIADVGGRLIPFEVKYKGSNVGSGELKGVVEFCREHKVRRAYVITKDAADFGVLRLAGGEIEVLKIPAHLACYWLGRSELEATELQEIDA